MAALPDLWNWYFAQIERDGGGFLMFTVYTLMFFTERLIYAFHPGHRGTWNNWDGANGIATSLMLRAAEALGTAAFFVFVYQAVYTHLAPFQLPIAWWVFLFAFVLNDFCYWLDHVISHRNGFFWTFHQTHHASREMNLSVSPRGHVLAGLLQPAYFLLALAGVPLIVTIAVKFLGNVWGVFNHTRLIGRMGPLERWICTPANHRVHHGTDPKYLDKNYGQTLLIWDRLFGTWQPEEEEPTYGLVKQIDSHNPIRHQIEPLKGLWTTLRRAPDWRARLGYLWHPPGWSHDGNHQRSRELYEAWAAGRTEGHTDEKASAAPILSPAE